MNQDFAAGASAARNKIAKYFRRNGLPIRTSNYGCPPCDEDFLRAALAVAREEASASTSNALVLFKWWHSQFHFRVPTSVVESLSADRRRRHYLFGASSVGGWNSFYLGADASREVVVHRRKHWSRSTPEALDTTLIWFDRLALPTR